MTQNLKGSTFMDSKSYFILGCKLFGVYCLLLGVPYLGSAISTFVSQDIPAELNQVYFVNNTVLRLIPILLIGGGLYLLGGGESIYEFAYPDHEEKKSDFEEKFFLALKILGVYLIVTYLPYLLRVIAELVTNLSSPPMLRTPNIQSIIIKVISNASGFLLGLYLLKSGKIFMKYGLIKS